MNNSDKESVKRSGLLSVVYGTDGEQDMVNQSKNCTVSGVPKPAILPSTSSWRKTHKVQ